MSTQTVLPIKQILREITFSSNSFYNSNNETWMFYKNVEILKQTKGFIFSGRGKSKEFCGEYSKTYSCECKHTTKVIHHSCNRLECPVCFHKVIRRTTSRIVERFKEIKKALIKIGEKPYFRHISFNTVWDINVLNYTKYRRKLLRILKKYNLSGILIFHNHRKKTIKGKWKAPSGRQYTTSIKALDIKPHFHFVGWGYLPNETDFKDKHKFTYTNITSKNFSRTKSYTKVRRRLVSRKRLNMRGIKGVIGYLLTHTSFIPGKHSYSWTNKFSYNQMRKIEIINQLDPVVCENCNSLCYKIINEPKAVTGSLNEGFKHLFNLNYQLDYDHYLQKRIKIYYLEFKNWS